ncbi:Glyoxalase/Bleomycin resistance protein/Dihydroxybiphenyl dioxygenase [Annulohypoxylon bovei var. microspora]|nr:Glyoxalase/Bleomycin resistance protein/Dihydroxybiphenyl dioxygenase [Annulohypoxylon bovei var. microspora]
MAANGSASTSEQLSKTLSPVALCHVVLRTTPEGYEKLVDFYLTLLGAKITQKSDRLAFLSYDYEHHRLAVVADPNSYRRRPEGSQVGLHHVAFGFETLSDLATAYEQRKAVGILPVWCVNHGMSTSMYYEDPDGNEIEFQVDNFDTVQEAVDFMASKDFEENPVGVDFKIDDFVKRVRSGEDEKVIKARPNIGKRDGK